MTADGKKYKTLKTGHIILILLTVTILVYSNSINNAILEWDDAFYVNEEPQNKDLSIQGLKDIFTSTYVEMYHPLTIISFAISYKLWGLNPAPYHMFNLVFHLINTILVFLLLYKMTNRKSIATIVALFFAIHPMHVESVAWIAERKDQLSGFFLLSCLVSYVLYIKKSLKIRYLLLASGCFLLSLFSKPQFVLLPLLLLLLDYFFQRKFEWRLMVEKIPVAIFSGTFILISYLTQEGIGITYPTGYHYTLFDRFLFVNYGLMIYFVKMIFPINLSAFYAFPDKANGMLPIEYYIAPFVVALVIWIVYKAGKHRKPLIFGFLFYFITIALVLQWFLFGPAIIQEHYSYIPYIGLFYLVGYFVVYFYRRVNEKQKILILATVIGISLFYAVSSHLRIRVYKSDVTWFSDIVKHNPDRLPDLHVCLGNALGRQNDIQESIELYTKAMSISPSHFDAYYNRGLALYHMGRYPDAVKDYDTALWLSPASDAVHNNLGIIYRDLHMWDMAIEAFQKAIQYNPSEELYQNNLQNAIEQKSVGVSPTVHEYVNQSVIYYHRQHFHKSIAACERVLEIDPDNALAYNNMGSAYIELEKFDKAVQACQTAVELDPNTELYLNNLQLAQSRLKVSGE